MRILLTGGAGYVGSHVLSKILSIGHEICVVDNFSNGNRQALERVKTLTGTTFEIFDCDICDDVLLGNICDHFKPEAVIHLAGLKAVGESVRVPLNYYWGNVAGTIKLLQAMDQCGCKTMIFSSSANVYAEHDSPINEMKAINPINPYGRTKYFIEEIINDWVQTNSNKSAVVLRYFNPVGAHKSGFIGESSISEPNNLVPLVSQVAAGKRDCLYVFGNDYNTKDGTAIRDYIHIMDLVTGHLAALSHATSHAGKEVFNLGNGIGYSVLDVIQTFERVTGTKIPIKITPRRLGDVCSSVANADKAARVLGWSPQLTLEQMCEDAWRWQSQNPEGFGK
jgi:UDP-glucose 4-epimerase